MTEAFLLACVFFSLSALLILSAKQSADDADFFSHLLNNLFGDNNGEDD